LIFLQAKLTEWEKDCQEREVTEDSEKRRARAGLPVKNNPDRAARNELPVPGQGSQEREGS
jgi:hypothetical protein